MAGRADHSVSILISVAVVRKSQKHFKAQQDSLGELNGTITELYTGYNEILLFGRQQSSQERFKEINGRLQKHALKAQFVSSMMSPLISLSVYLCIGGVAVSGTVFVIQGMLTVGNLQAFIRYIWQCNEPSHRCPAFSTDTGSICRDEKNFRDPR